jgi:curved DNA-binding protein CbpA
MSFEQDHYKILDVALNANTKEIKEAYRKLAFKYHPDRNPMNPAANEKMQEINEAYTILSNPTQRKEYDIPLGSYTVTPQFKKGSKVKVNSRSNTPYGDRIGVIDSEPIKDTFRFWYKVKFESKGFSSFSRFAEQELSEVNK